MLITETLFQPILLHYVDSTSMVQKFLTAVIAEEWAHEYDSKSDASGPSLHEASVLAKELSAKTLAWLQGSPPAAYHEMIVMLARLHSECIALLHAFNQDCKLPASSIPSLGTEIDITGKIPDCFTIETAQAACGPMYTRLKDSLGRTKKRELAVIGEKRTGILASIDRYIEVKTQHDTRVSAAFAAAFVAFKSMPDKVSPVVKGIMNGVKASSHYFPIYRYRSYHCLERRECRLTNPFGGSRCLFHRVLCKSSNCATSGQNRQKSMHFSLSRYSSDARIRFHAEAVRRCSLIFFRHQRTHTSEEWQG